MTVRCDIVTVTMTTLGQRIRHCRETLGLTQKQLADRARVSQPTIAELEMGSQKTTRKLPSIAKALKVSIADLDPDFKKEWLGEDKTTVTTTEPIGVNLDYLEQVVEGAFGMLGFPPEAAGALTRLLFELAAEPPTPSSGPDYHRSLAEREVRRFLKAKHSER